MYSKKLRILNVWKHRIDFKTIRIKFTQNLALRKDI